MGIVKHRALPHFPLVFKPLTPNLEVWFLHVGDE